MPVLYDVVYFKRRFSILQNDIYTKIFTLKLCLGLNEVNKTIEVMNNLFNRDE